MYIYIHVYIHIYTYICVCVCTLHLYVCAFCLTKTLKQALLVKSWPISAKYTYILVQKFNHHLCMYVT